MGYIADLEEHEWWHSPSLSYDPAIPETFMAVLVGWLGNSVPDTGQVAVTTLKKLIWACDHRTIDQGSLGEHECEVCKAHTDRGEILIISNKKMYVAPRMILHYIKDHAYLPPREFLEAVDQMVIG